MQIKIVELVIACASLIFQVAILILVLWNSGGSDSERKMKYAHAVCKACGREHYDSYTHKMPKNGKCPYCGGDVLYEKSNFRL